MPISIEDWELLGFFNVEPELVDPDVPWQYTRSTYRTRAADYDVTFSIHPEGGDISLRVTREGFSTFEIGIEQVSDVQVASDRGVEILFIQIAGRSWMQLSLKPRVEIIQSLTVRQS